MFVYYTYHGVRPKESVQQYLGKEKKKNEGRKAGRVMDKKGRGEERGERGRGRKERKEGKE